MNKIYYKTKLSKFWWLNPWKSCTKLEKETNEIISNYVSLIRKSEDDSEKLKEISKNYNDCLKENKEYSIALGIYGIKNGYSIIEFVNQKQSEVVSLNNSKFTLSKESIIKGERILDLEDKLNYANAELKRLKYIIYTYEQKRTT